MKDRKLMSELIKRDCQELTRVRTSQHLSLSPSLLREEMQREREGEGERESKKRAKIVIFPLI